MERDVQVEAGGREGEYYDHLVGMVDKMTPDVVYQSIQRCHDHQQSCHSEQKIC